MRTVTKSYRITFSDGLMKDYSVDAEIVNGFFESFGKVSDSATRKNVSDETRESVLTIIDSALFPSAHVNDDYDVADLNPDVVLPFPVLTLAEAIQLIESAG